MLNETGNENETKQKKEKATAAQSGDGIGVVCNRGKFSCLLFQRGCGHEPLCCRNIDGRPFGAAIRSAVISGAHEHGTQQNAAQGSHGAKCR